LGRLPRGARDARGARGVSGLSAVLGVLRWLRGLLVLWVQRVQRTRMLRARVRSIVVTIHPDLEVQGEPGGTRVCQNVQRGWRECKGARVQEVSWGRASGIVNFKFGFSGFLMKLTKLL